MSWRTTTATNPLRNTIFVQSADDLSGTLDSETAYLLDGVIDMGSTQIRVPQNGLTIVGFGLDVSGLISSEPNYKMFIVDDTYSGNLFLDSMKIEVTGLNSQVFDLDNQENFAAVEFNDVNFNVCTSLGLLNDYRQLLTRNVAFFAPQDGLTFDGNWFGGMTIRDTIVIALPAGVTMFKAGGSLIISTAVRTNINAANIANTAVLFDFAPSNIIVDGGMSLSGVITNPDANSLPNFLASNVKALFKQCIGIRNTYRGGRWTITTEATTVIPAINTLVKLAGTTTYTDLEWFSNTTDNAFVYDGSQEIDVVIRGIVSIDGGNNDQIEIQLRQWDDSASSYIDLGDPFRTTLNGGPAATRGENTAFQAIATLNQNDRIEVWARNTSDSQNITVVQGGNVIIEERPQ